MPSDTDIPRLLVASPSPLLSWQLSQDVVMASHALISGDVTSRDVTSREVMSREVRRSRER